MTNKLKLSIAFIVCIAIGIALGFAYVQIKPIVSQWVLASTKNYITKDTELNSMFDAQRTIDLQWSMLIPEVEKAILEKYQQPKPSTPTEFTNNLLRSIEAASDASYSEAMTSINTVDAFDGIAISIPGFIVPIDYQDDQSPSNIFIVPYFGACIHFPPPPPNQIIFAQLESAFTNFEITQAYRINGVLRRGLFEDPLGTSAYILDVVSIEAYFDNPDDFRRH